MTKFKKSFTALIATLVLSSCANTVKLSERAVAIKENITKSAAHAFIKRQILDIGTTNGICLIGYNYGMTRIDDSIPVRVNDTLVYFSAYFARLGGVSGPIGSIRVTTEQSKGELSVDLSRIEEVRILNSNEILLGLCKRFEPGMIVVLKPEDSLPDYGELLMNVRNDEELDRLLANLSFLSPQAKFKSGIGL